MTGRSPARVPALLALVATAVALVVIVSSGTGEEGEKDSGDGSRPAATATATATKKSSRRARTYTVKPGDTPSGIAAARDLALDELLAANPDIEPSALRPGQRLRLP